MNTNNPDLSTVAAGRMRDEMKRQIEIRIHQSPELTTRLRVAEAAEWIRHGAAGRALEVLEELLAEFERVDREDPAALTAAQVAAWEAEVKANPPKRVQFVSGPDHICTGKPPF